MYDPVPSAEQVQKQQRSVARQADLRTCAPHDELGTSVIRYNH